MTIHEDYLPDAPYGIICPFHGKQGLDKASYDLQMSLPDEGWICPVSDCGRLSAWDDVRYERSELMEVTSRTPDYDDDDTLLQAFDDDLLKEMEFEDSRDAERTAEDYGEDE